MQGVPQKLDQAMVDKIEGTPLAPMGVAMQEEDVHRPIFRDIHHPPETNRGGPAAWERPNHFRQREVRCVREVSQVPGHEVMGIFSSQHWVTPRSAGQDLIT